ncbi:MAG TPA: hypothetical protein VFD73_02725, partial [Gemmatimonadales bacterium]|nr:hypothetical protein [Gemmatimonadales bacterium]
SRESAAERPGTPAATAAQAEVTSPPWYQFLTIAGRWRNQQRPDLRRTEPCRAGRYGGAPASASAGAITGASALA